VLFLANFIPEDKISEIKNTADIVDVVSDAVLLKKAGRNYVGLCPFHVEKTPSFTVSPEKQIFYCFGCGAGGNIFSFLMKKEGLSFPEAARLLAKRCGIEIPTSQISPEQKRRITEREKLLEANKQAMGYYRQFLLDPSSGKKAMEYLENRGLTHEIINRFHLGYAPAGWDHLVNFISKKGISCAFGEKAGLIAPRKSKGGFYDRFRDRIIFPIFNISNQVIGFGGRVLDDSLPKYLNSPETPVFNKSKSLYGFALAKTTCRERQTVYIVEGYFDVLALHQHGILNSVATLGTSLTREHIQHLRGFIGEAGRVILVFDSDDAGVKAARRSVELLEQGFVDAKILVLDAGYDPDSYIFKFGSESFLARAGDALNTMSFLIDSAVKKHGFSNEGKIRIVSDLKESLSSIHDGVARAVYIKELSECTGIDEQTILAYVREFSAENRRRNKKQAENRRVSTYDPEQVGSLTRDDGNTILGMGSKIERRIISMMLQFPEILPEIHERNLIEGFENDALRSIGSLILAKGAAGWEASDVLALIDDKQLRSEIAMLAIQEDVWDREGCIRLMAQYEASRRRRENLLLQQIKAAEANKDDDLVSELLRKKQIQARKRH